MFNKKLAYSGELQSFIFMADSYVKNHAIMFLLTGISFYNLTATIALNGNKKMDDALPFLVSIAGIFVGLGTHGNEHQCGQNIKENAIQSVYHCANIIAQIGAPLSSQKIHVQQLASCALILGLILMPNARNAFKTLLRCGCKELNSEQSTKQIISLCNVGAASTGIGAVSALLSGKKDLASILYICSGTISNSLSARQIKQDIKKQGTICNSILRGKFLFVMGSWLAGLSLLLTFSTTNNDPLKKVAQIVQALSILSILIHFTLSQQHNNQVHISNEDV